MKYKLAIILIQLVSALFHAQGQDLKNNISFNTGVGYIMRQDLIFSPFIHKDFASINVGLRYERKSKYYQTADIRYSSFNPILKDSYEYRDNGKNNTTTPHHFTIIDIDYSFGKEIGKRDKSSTIVSGLFSMDIQSLNYSYGRSSSFGYHSVIGLGGMIRQEYNINDRSKITGQFALPLFNWFSRSPYLVNDDEFIENTFSHSGIKTFLAFLGDGQLVTLNKLQTFDLSLSYCFTLNKRWNVGTTYLFEFIHTNEPQTLISFKNSLFISTNYKF